MTCRCGHSRESHRKDGDCLALVSLNGVFCRCKQFVEARNVPENRAESQYERPKVRKGKSGHPKQ